MIWYLDRNELTIRPLVSIEEWGGQWKAKWVTARGVADGCLLSKWDVFLDVQLAIETCNTLASEALREKKH